MGVGLEAGLALDAIAEELAALVDEGDLGALRGDAEALGESRRYPARICQVQ